VIDMKLTFKASGFATIPQKPVEKEEQKQEPKKQEEIKKG